MPALPITRTEFARLLARTRPPSGWSQNIAVANSGGPDSTCLLFLLTRHFSENPPSRVISLTVDHDLQKSSHEMAAHCERVANSLHVRHITTKVPWGTPPFPPPPDPSDPFEEKARDVRYNLLWKNMAQENIDILALGHHVDDQVETALMRLGRHSSELGGRGMLPYRRWGMGISDPLGWTGYEGMNKWMIRPLLEVTKDRILATCEENELEYVTDATNFQPGITVRNALRSVIRATDNGEKPPELDTFPPEIGKRLASINATISKFPSLSIDIYSTSDRLRGAIKAIDNFAADIESQVNSAVEQIRLPSPPGTFIISTRSLASITNPLLQRAIILRIMRYISFHPWGSLRSQARRSRHSLDQVVEKIWNPHPFESGIKMFTAGAGVLWCPVVVDNDPYTIPGGMKTCLDIGGRIKRPNLARIVSGEIKLAKGLVGWMAMRQPPFASQKLKQRHINDTLNIDMTKQLGRRLKSWDEGKGEGSKVVEVLYDCRFLMRFDLEKIPKEIKDIVLGVNTTTMEREPSESESESESKEEESQTKILVKTWTKYYWPKVVVTAPGKEEVVLHANIDSSRPSSLAAELSRMNEGKKPVQNKNYLTRIQHEEDPPVYSDWIDISWIRILDPC